MSLRVLYITIDGILSHLGFSQVVRVVEGLAAAGLRYSIVSLERRSDLANVERVRWLEARLEGAGITWERAQYAEGGGAYVAGNQLALAALAAREAARRRVHLVHARGYHGAAVAVGLARPWVFDARGYWIDERIEEGRWFTSPARIAAARAVERTLYKRATRVVTLTELHAEDVRRGLFGGARGAVDVIPTCADYDDFRPVTEAEMDPSVPPTIGIVGSVNRAYLVADTGRLCAAISRRRPETRFHVVSTDHAQWRASLERAGVPGRQVRAERVPHEAMPAILRRLSWIVMLLTPETQAKRAMMPTKLSECFASGVRVCVHGCNREVAAWVVASQDGVVMDDVDDVTIDRAADLIHRGVSLSERARRRTADHFSLRAGIERYRRLLASAGTAT